MKTQLLTRNAVLTAFLTTLSFLSFSQPGLSGAAQSALFSKVDSLIQAKNFDSAVVSLNKLVMNGKSVKNRWQTGKAYSMLGNVQLMQRHFDKALENYHQSLEYFDAKEYPAEVIRVYTNTGTLYSGLKVFKKAKEYLLKALDLNPEENTDRLKTMANLAGVYLDMKERNLAFNTFNAAVRLAQKLNNLQVEAVLQTNLSNYFIEGKDWQRAIQAARKSLAIRQKLHQPASVITLNNLGYALTQTGNAKEGITDYEEALTHADLAEKKQLLYNLYNASRLIHDDQQAFKYIEAYNAVRDSIAVLNYEQKVAGLTASYGSVEKEQKIANLEKENILQKRQLRQQTYLIIAAVLITLLAAALIFMWLKNYKVKQALEKSQMRRRFLLLQLNPHFIFNALQSIQRFIFQNDKEHSMAYLNSFGRLIRLVLENSDREMIPLDEEIEMLTHYLDLQKLNSENGFSYEINTGKNIDTAVTEIPAMLLQPFVENAVVHGLKKHQNGKIEISFDLKPNGLHIFIRDNGEGLSSSAGQAGNTLHKSMGTDILNQRITEFNKENNYQIKLAVSMHKADNDDPGTRVHLHIANIK